MNEHIKKIAQESYFDPNQIIADVVCPDYNGTELFKLADAFNALPKHVRNDIVNIITRNHLNFTLAIIQECIDVVDKVYHEETGMGNKLGRRHTPYQETVNAIEDHFGIEE